MNKVGLLGGTFNPIHNGHLILAEEAREQFSLNQIIFIPNHLPPHRDAGEARLASDQDRHQMCRLATADNAYFQTSRIELDRAGVSYTYDTVLQLKRENPEADYYFICGGDSITRYRWHRFDDLMELLAGLLVAGRGKEGKQEVLIKLRSEFPQYVDKLRDVRMPAVEISASLIRQKLLQGESIRYLVPEAVAAYIRGHQLYQRSSTE